jgi:uncharacterized protein (UPF0212 family)
MRDGELLELWTRAGRAAGPSRAGVLASGLAGVAGGADAPVGDVNRALLGAWRSEFGDGLECVATCPACGERLEAEVSVAAILAAAGGAPEPPALEGVILRWPTLGDLEAAAATGDPEDARRELARRSLGADTAPADELADAVSAALDAADPHLAVRLGLDCPTCGTSFEAAVDVGVHVWAALDRRADVLMSEVAGLAAAYGWTEDEVLRLPRARRRLYADRASG